MDINGKLTVISTFCGTGGSSLGYKWAGYKELLAIDFESHAVECFKLNFPEVPCWKKSVIDITGKEIMEFCNIKVGELDVFDGSPPCQGFSTAGKRVVSDPRNDLFNHYVRLVNEIQPKVFVMENVTGMAKGKMKGKFIEIMKTLKGLNYNVKCKQMNAMYYGVPQSRERLIFIGVRKDLEKYPSYPVPRGTIISVREALKIDGYAEYRRDYSHGRFETKKAHFNRPSLTITKNGSIKIVSFRNVGENTYSSLDAPCPTIPKCGGHIELNGERTTWSIKAIKKLCSFPEDFKLIGSTAKKRERLGNAVMPKFMQAIAETIKKDILC